VLLTGFDDAGTDGLMREIMPDRNDRLRTVAYQWFERHPAPPVLPALIAAADRENTEFVRPALMRALAAQCGDARARAVLVPLVTRGEDLFRGAVIEALGDYHCTAAVPAIAEVAALDGPLQDDALTALGLVGGPVARRALETARPAAPRELQPTISASLCLSGGDCDREMKYIADTFTFALADPSYQPLLRGAVHAMTTLALHGKAALVDTLLDAGVPAVEPARAAIALGVGRIALRDPPLVVDRLLERNDHDGAFELMLDAFDMLSEDFDEEQFFVETRRAYWAAPAGSARQKAADALIQKLEF
jgi:hypothetical protein